MGRSVISQSFRNRFAEEHNRTCAFCGKKNLLSANELREQGDGNNYDLMYTLDHILPVVRGGKNKKENLQLLCFSCNSSKGTKTNEEFFFYKKAEKEIEELIEKTAVSLNLEKELVVKVASRVVVNEAHVFFTAILEAVKCQKIND